MEAGTPQLSAHQAHNTHVLPGMNEKQARLARMLDAPTVAVVLLVIPALILDFSEVGGLVGSSDDFGQGKQGTVTSCFWDIQTSYQTTSAGSTGKTTAEMRMASTFLNAGWDFIDETANGTEDIWWILEGQDYPRLWWELIPEN